MLKSFVQMYDFYRETCPRSVQPDETIPRVFDPFYLTIFAISTIPLRSDKYKKLNENRSKLSR